MCIYATITINITHTFLGNCITHYIVCSTMYMHTRSLICNSVEFIINSISTQCDFTLVIGLVIDRQAFI